MTKKPLSGIAPIKKAAKAPPYKPSPHGEGGPRQRWIGCFRMQHKCASLSPILPSVFHTIVTLSAPAGHLPLEGKAAIREYPLLKKVGEAATSTLNPEPNESKAKRTNPRSDRESLSQLSFMP